MMNTSILLAILLFFLTMVQAEFLVGGITMLNKPLTSQTAGSTPVNELTDMMFTFHVYFAIVISKSLI